MKQIVLLLFFIAIVGGTISLVRAQSPAQEKQTHGYWSDPSTGLMWAAKDNGTDITWGNAMKYCQNLGLAGYSGWRLPSVDELQQIYDGSGFSPTHSGGSTIGLAGRPRGELLLTGAREWSSSRVLDDRGRNSGFAWEFDYPHGRRWKDPLGYKGSLRALCVRHP
jgi:hypothetical protein